MSTLALMVQRIKTLTNNHVSEADIKALINRVHQTEVESREWHYRRKRMSLVSSALKSSGTVSIEQGSTLVMGTGTDFELSDVGRFIRLNHEDMPLLIRDIQIFPGTLGFLSYDVTPDAAIGIQTSFLGAGATHATFTVLGGNIRYHYDGSIPTPTDGHLIQSGNEFTLDGSLNLLRFRMIAETTTTQVSVTLQRQIDEVYLETAWPGESLVDVSYELFTRFYPMPADCLDVLTIKQANRPLQKLVQEEVDLMDPARQTRGDLAYKWANAGTNSSNRRLIELWPSTTVPRVYEVEYMAGHTPLVANEDRPLCPSTVVENKALSEACLTAFAKTGDDRWTRLASMFEQKYYMEIEDLKAADAQRFGVLEQVLDLDGIGYRNHTSWDYWVTHDGGY